MFNARHFFASYWVRGHKAVEAFTQSSLGCGNHIAFGRTYVHQQGIGLQHIAHGSKALVHSADGHGQQHQISTLHGFGHTATSLVDDLEFNRTLTGFFRSAETCNGLH